MGTPPPRRARPARDNSFIPKHAYSPNTLGCADRWRAHFTSMRCVFVQDLIPLVGEAHQISPAGRDAADHGRVHKPICARMADGGWPADPGEVVSIALATEGDMQVAIAAIGDRAVVAALAGGIVARLPVCTSAVRSWMNSFCIAHRNNVTRMLPISCEDGYGRWVVGVHVKFSEIVSSRPVDFRSRASMKTSGGLVVR